MDIIRTKQQLWAKSHITDKMRDGNYHDTHTKKPDDNIYKGLTPETRKAFDDAKGGELIEGKQGDPAKMTALHSSSALCVNVFQYFQNKPNNLKMAVLQACGLVAPKNKGNVESFEFECRRFKIKDISTPNIDFVAEIAPSRIIAIESKFNEPYAYPHDNFLREEYYIPENKSIWDDLPELYDALDIEHAEEITKKDKNGNETKGKLIFPYYKYLDAVQLLKHLLGVVNSSDKKSEIWLTYLWYDSLGEKGLAHRNEIEDFRKLIEEKTSSRIKFRHITYQEVICNLNKILNRAEHEEYLNYITSRYL